MTEFEKYMEDLDKKINNMKRQKDASRFFKEGKKFGLYTDNRGKEDGNKTINSSL